MPTTPPEQAAAFRRNHPYGGRRPPRRWGAWIPLGPAVAGICLSLGFGVTLRLWDRSRGYEPLDLSPPFAVEPLPGASLDSLIRRHGSQLPLLLNPAPQPNPLVAPPPISTPNTVADRPSQDRTRTAPALPPPEPSTSGEPAATEITLPPPPPSFGVPEIPPPPAVDFQP